ncbi:hypothetical protein ITJ43_14775 [Microbacterium sp. VKM Ac-2870]|uniref:hypothetical protein n=1 Tax=Microbacterium sp. VKM Ac-2870 TaxID=2783825 RepID=UPI00188B4F40|nr:hypothetical protein [Microbacterium sp. VKM Ac-2870]MBF4563394.1 hypothetical protein [Microbacterium sp. VKM Ac-2870]
MKNTPTAFTWLARDDRLRILVDIGQAATDTATASHFVDRAGSITALAYALLELVATVLIDDATWAPSRDRPTPPFDVPAKLFGRSNGEGKNLRRSQGE